jgi:hypothetical protein
MSSRSLRILLERLCEVLFLIGGVLKGIGPWVLGKITGAKQQTLMYIRYSQPGKLEKHGSTIICSLAFSSHRSLK